MNTIDEFMPTIEISDGDDRPLTSYQSLIIPRIGDFISWVSDNGNILYGEVQGVQHEVVKGRVVEVCKRVFVTVDDIE